MKRGIAIVLTIAIILVLCACGKSETAEKKTEETTGTQSENVIVVPDNNQTSVKRDVDGNDLPEKLTVPLGDENFVIEACKTRFVERDTYTQMRMEIKVRNLTEYSPPNTYIGFLFKAIDENGDALDSATRYLGSTDIAPSGRAQWLEAISNEDGATGIMIFGYHIYGSVDIKASFDTPIELYSKDYKITYDEIKGTGS